MRWRLLRVFARHLGHGWFIIGAVLLAFGAGIASVLLGASTQTADWIVRVTLAVGLAVAAICEHWRLSKRQPDEETQ